MEIRDQRGRFVPGVSGNAGGRRKGVSSIVREAADIDSLIATLFGDHAFDRDVQGGRQNPSRPARLLDRGWGKASRAFPADRTRRPVGNGRGSIRAIRDIAAELRGTRGHTDAEHN